MKLNFKKITAVMMAALVLCGMFIAGASASEEVCSEHSFDEGTVIVAPDCKNPGKKLYSCTQCDAVKTELMIPSGHIYDVNYLVIEEVGGTCTVKGTRTYTLTCPVCEDVILCISEPYKLSHEWEKLSVIKQPECYNYGEELWGCINCDSTQIRETLPQHTGLKGTGEWDVCFDYSQHAVCYECGGSGRIYYTGSHSFITYTVIKEPTCTEDGSAFVRCARESCEYFYGGYMTLNQTGHTYEWEEDVQPDCCMNAKEGGAVCTACGDVLVETVYYGEYFEHNFDVEIIKAAEGESKGRTLYTCTNDTWSSMYHVFEIEYSVADVIPGVSEDGKFFVNTEKAGVAENIRDITGLYEENISFEALEENNVFLDEEGNVVVDDSGSVTVVVKSPAYEAVIVIEAAICDTLEIVSDDTFETGRALELEVIKNPGAFKAENVQWTSSDEKIVFVSDGRLVAVGTGKVTLTAVVDGLTVSKEITLVEAENVNKIKFNAIDKMHYVIEDCYAVYNADTLYWADNSEMRFKVHTYGTFPYETYIVYINGKEAVADSDGYFYVTTDGEDVRVTISGAMYENGEEGQKTNFWQAILSFINKILEFFGISL